ncbi:hypothetical protein JOD54_005786 [Actinokineospora baliensis]|nr:hypothetical protein [Actinokineospora baliensis]
MIFGSPSALHRIIGSPAASRWIRDLSAGSMWWTCFAWGPYDSRGRTAKQGPKSMALQRGDATTAAPPHKTGPPHRADGTSDSECPVAGNAVGVGVLGWHRRFWERWLSWRGLTRWAGWAGWLGGLGWHQRLPSVQWSGWQGWLGWVGFGWAGSAGWGGTSGFRVSSGCFWRRGRAAGMAPATPSVQWSAMPSESGGWDGTKAPSVQWSGWQGWLGGVGLGGLARWVGVAPELPSVQWLGSVVGVGVLGWHRCFWERWLSWRG